MQAEERKVEIKTLLVKLKKKSSRQKKVMSRPAGAKNILERGMVGRGKVLQMGPKVKCGWWVNSS